MFWNRAIRPGHIEKCGPTTLIWLAMNCTGSGPGSSEGNMEKRSVFYGWAMLIVTLLAFCNFSEAGDSNSNNRRRQISRRRRRSRPKSTALQQSQAGLPRRKRIYGEVNRYTRRGTMLFYRRNPKLNRIICIFNKYIGF